MAARPPAPDQAARDAAIAERARNVVIDAGAGTGKTSLIVARLIEMIAPSDDTTTPVPMSRIAAVTFTRKAAGELKLRIREAVLRALAHADTSGTRRARLGEALSVLDTAYVGTIHSFADRLLRMRPKEARISPAYEIAEDADELLHETFLVLMHSVDRGILADRMHGTRVAAHAKIAEVALRDVQRIDLLRETKEYENYVVLGIDALVSDFISSRDIDVATAELFPLDLDALQATLRAFIDRAQAVRADTVGGGRLHALSEGFEDILDETDPVQVYSAVNDLLTRHGRKADDWRKGQEFDGDTAGYKLGQHLIGNGKPGEPAFRSDILRVLGAWFGPRLLHVRPVAIELYEQIKRRHQVVDQLDLLIKLRNLLRDDLPSRAFYQGLFEHVFVDEFQDTDPLQVEVVAYLCERTAAAQSWDAVQLAPGKLTIVGDPKQSIYRFRRADVEMYDRARNLVAASNVGCLEVELEANFRSRETLIDWFNDRYDEVLSISHDNRRFDAKDGTVYNRHLAKGRTGDVSPSVHVIPFDLPSGEGKADEYRVLEGEAMAHYLKWLIEESGTQISDPTSGDMRRLGYGDVAVLCLATTKLDYFFPQLDKLDVPYAARGATLFLRDPLHQQFLLGLRALADRDDGIAEAALLRPPFFALDSLDLVLERAAATDASPGGPEDSVERVRSARQLVSKLRRSRFSQSPDATARDLLEETLLGDTVARGPNGLQRLDRLRELCLILGQRAMAEGLDYDLATARMREWVDDPAQIDPPHPVGSEAIQIMTVHQAKGLEFPVVVFWDGRALWSDITRAAAFRTTREGSSWAIAIDGDKLACEVPHGVDLVKREQEYRKAERRRLVYVIGTRARDILVLPKAGSLKANHVCHTLLESQLEQTMVVRTSYRAADGDTWWEHTAGRPRAALPPQVMPDVDARWREASSAALRPHLAPIAVSGYAQTRANGVASPSALAAPDESFAERSDDAESESQPEKAGKPRAGRYGNTFGTTVHRALELLLLGHCDSAQVAVERAIRETGLAEHHEALLADVERAVAALGAERLLPEHARTVALEYPIAGRSPDRQMLLGIIDFLSSDGQRIDVIDFKTDQPPEGDVTQTHAAYVRQARWYGEMLTAAGLKVARLGLLFTGDGQIRWVQSR